MKPGTTVIGIEVDRVALPKRGAEMDDIVTDAGERRRERRRIEADAKHECGKERSKRRRRMVAPPLGGRARKIARLPIDSGPC